MAFRKKSKTREVIVPKLTLDSLHKNMTSTFIEKQKTLPELNQEYNDIFNEIRKLKMSPSYLSPIPDLKTQSTLWSLEEKLKTLEMDITNIQTKTNERTYLIKTGKILNKYYKLLNKEKELTELSSKLDFQQTFAPSQNNSCQSTCISNNNSNNNNNATSLIDLLDSNIGNMTEDKVTRNFPGKKQKKKDIMDWLSSNNSAGNTDDELDKQKLYDQYMKIIDSSYVSQIDDELELFDTCGQCHGEMLLNHNSGMLNCKNCGLIEKIIVDSDKQSHKEPPKEMTSFSYKRINHLNEILSQFQAKETTEIPAHVYEKIEVELKKARITDMTQLTKDKLREILKKIDETDYYEHIPYIINQLNGLPPPVISAEVEEIIRGLFLQAQPPFNTYCPDDRKNFLTYGYTLYKLFELLELDEYLCNFKFLKDRKKLYDQEQIWKKICNELKWEFIPSI
jgi:hypothetical protein